MAQRLLPYFLLAVVLVAIAVEARCHLPTQRTQCMDQTCNESTGQCVGCTSSSQCWDRALACTGNATVPGLCELEPMYSYKFNAATFFAMVLCLLVCTIGVVAGVGGGGILVPMYAGMIGLPLADAVIASLATIVGQSLVNVPAVMVMHHPQWQPPGPSRPLCNYKILALWFPASAIGNMIGQLLGRIVPDWLRVALLFLLSLVVIVRVVKKAFDQRKLDETRRHEKSLLTNSEREISVGTVDPKITTRGGLVGDEALSGMSPIDQAAVIAARKPKFAEDTGEEMSSEAQLYRPPSTTPPPSTNKSPVEDGDKDGEKTFPETTTDTTDAKENEKEEEEDTTTKVTTQQIQQDNMHVTMMDRGDDNGGDYSTVPYVPRVQWKEWLILVFLVLLGSAMARVIFKGDTLECGSWGFYVVIVVVCFIDFAVAFAFRRYLFSVAQRVAAGIRHPVHLPFSWELKNTTILPTISGAAGLGSSLLGIGGGMITNPLLLEAGCAPEESSATGAVITGLVALQSLLSAASDHKIKLDYTLTFGALGLISTFIGRFVILRFIKRKGWSFLIVISLAVMLIGTVIAVVGFGIVKIVAMQKYGAGLGFGSVCGN